ncbi:MAG: family 10 glycosylhydrolase [Fimbriimonadaceae bacterium]|nr:family 10 glycosylhydrolase [Fimbriimonadaceae bacterium]
MSRSLFRAGLMACLLVGAAVAQPILLVQDERAEGLYETYVRTSILRRALHRAGLEHDVVPADQLGSHSARSALLAVLPSNPSLADPAADWLRRFSDGNGRLIVCPPAPPQLASLLGVFEPRPLAAAPDHLLEAVQFDTSLIPGLPATWRQSSWTYQPFAADPTAQLLGRWAGADPLLNAAPVVTATPRGAFLGAALLGDDRAAEAQLFTALATHYFPQLWHTCLPRLLHDAGRVGDVTSLGALRDLVERSSAPAERRQAALVAVDDAAQRVERARRIYEYGKKLSALPPGKVPASTPVERYLPAAQLIWQAQTSAEQAYYLGQTARAGEFRGVWLQQLGDLKAWGWERVIRELQRLRVQALFVCVANGGYANYPSRVLPHVTAEGQDPLAEALRWCRQAGIECHVWMINNYIRPLTPATHLAELQAADRLQRTREGRVLPWLRPAHPANVAQQLAVAREVLTRYEVDGLHLDYIRYSPEGDFSEAERRQFETETGHRIEQWPADIERGGTWRVQWGDWKRGQVNAVVEGLAGVVRAVRPRCKLSAAVYPIWDDARWEVAQDPAWWAQHGWVDFLTPMNYHTDDSTFYRFLKVQARAAGDRVPLYPGLASFRHESPADTISQIRRLRAMDIPGYVLFHLDRRLLSEWLPALASGLAAPDAWLGPAPPWQAPR